MTADLVITPMPLVARWLTQTPATFSAVRVGRVPRRPALTTSGNRVRGVTESR